MKNNLLNGFNHAGLLLLVIVALSMTGCSDKDPLKIGFLGGVSGRVADLGIDGRNGVTLALEMRNAAGGIDGRALQLLSEDDGQDMAQAKAGLNRLIAHKVEAVIGPMTSAMAVAVVPLANASKMLLISPTVTTNSLSGKDDYFLRVISSTTAYAQKSADYHYKKQGSRRMAVIYDLRNQAYTESWFNDYRQTFEAMGGHIEVAVSFLSSNEIQFDELASQVLSREIDGVLILANSVDTALIAQQLRLRNQAIRINSSEWAATERLLELGGEAVEGMIFAQFIDRNSTRPGFVAFRRAYRERFGHETGFAGLTGYDAANVLFDALAKRKSGQSLKQVILQQREFEGAQSLLVFDDSGDASRETFLTTIRDGAFQRLP